MEFHIRKWRKIISVVHIAAICLMLAFSNAYGDAGYIGCYMDSQWTYDIPGQIYNGQNVCDDPDRKCTPPIPDPCCMGSEAKICFVAETYNMKQCLGCIAKTSVPINVLCGKEITCTELLQPTALSGWAVCDFIEAPCVCDPLDYNAMMREMRAANELRLAVYKYTCNCVAGTCIGQQIWP